MKASKKGLTKKRGVLYLGRAKALSPKKFFTGKVAMNSGDPKPRLGGTSGNGNT